MADRLDRASRGDSALKAQPVDSVGGQDLARDRCAVKVSLAYPPPAAHQAGELEDSQRGLDTQAC